MRATPLLLLTAVLVTVPSASADGLLEDVEHTPASPRPGQDVLVTVRLAGPADEVFLTHCRVEPNYACSPESRPMQRAEADDWTGLIPWQPQFFRGTQWVGYNLRVETPDGQEHVFPEENTPAAPPTLFEGAGPYYFYRIDTEPPGTPGPALWATLLALLIGGLRRGRHAA